MSNRTYAAAIIFGVFVGMLGGAWAIDTMTEIAASQVALNQ